MLARVDGAECFAIHRTYLGAGFQGKTSATPSKAMLGATRGGAVRLTSLHYTGGGALVVSEGIESGLSLLCGFLDQPAPVWAGLSAPGMAKLTLPRDSGHLIIAGDSDRAGQDATAKLGYRAVALGWRVSHLAPPDGLDWNDVLLLQGADA